jgi:hypothetical protein
LEWVFSFGPCRGAIRNTVGSTESVKRTLAYEAEESPLLETVAREWLVKTQQAGKGLAGAVEISHSAVIACSSEWCV